MPKLKTLDFTKVTLKERIAAKEMFGEDKGEELVEELKKKQQLQKEKSSLSKEAKARRQRALELKMMIEQAESLEEIAKIEEEIEKGKYNEFLLEEGDE